MHSSSFGVGISQRDKIIFVGLMCTTLIGQHVLYVACLNARVSLRLRSSMMSHTYAT